MLPHLLPAAGGALVDVRFLAAILAGILRDQAQLSAAALQDLAHGALYSRRGASHARPARASLNVLFIVVS
jgi:hypothetical protein